MAEQSCKDALSKCLATCIAATAALSRNETNQSHPLHIVRKDLLSLFALLRASSTKLSLALNPSRLEFSAAVPPVNDTARHVAAIVHCASLFVPTVHGQSLVNEVHRTVRHIMSATQDLLQHFLHVLALSSSNPQIYLRLTGTLHELIDQATSLPEDNRAAVSKQFNDNVSLLTDGIGELEGLISQNESDAPLPEDDFDDGWDELGMGSSGSDKMSPDELAVTKKVYLVLRLISTLVGRVSKDYLRPASSASPSNDFLLDPLVTRASSLSTSVDELVSVLDPPQSSSETRHELFTLRDHLNLMQTNLQSLIQDPTTSLAALKISEERSSSSSSSAPSDKWYQTCFSQIEKGIAAAMEQIPTV